MAEDFPYELVKQWDQDVLQRGGDVIATTYVRYFLGKHGPFSATKKKDEPFSVIEDQVKNQRRELESHARL